MDLGERLMAGEMRALARGISLVERNDPSLPALLAAVRGNSGRAHVVGITGPPGGGKSTLADGLLQRWRALERSVAVLAVDPSSPFSGGAILGDRVRMGRHTLDSGVFIRSMAARGHLGGLASATPEAVRLADAAGRDICLIETVGVGQSELEVMHTVDTVVVVTTPSSGDGIQMIKAGIMEIPDVFVVNKADLPGADRVVKELRGLVHEAIHGGAAGRRGLPGGAIWEPPVIRCVASEEVGVDDLSAAIDGHRKHLTDTGEITVRRRGRLIAEVQGIVVERAAREARYALQTWLADLDPAVDPATLDPYTLADGILGPGGALAG